MPRLTPEDPGFRYHGTVTGYTYKCRCELCSKAASEHSKRRRLEKRPPGTPRKNAAQHGTISKYATGCRCEICREAASAYQRKRYAALHPYVKKERPQPHHGTTAKYRQGCRCELCRIAKLGYDRAVRLKAGITPRSPKRSPEEQKAYLQEWREKNRQEVADQNRRAKIRRRMKADERRIARGENPRWEGWNIYLDAEEPDPAEVALLQQVMKHITERS